MRDVRQSRTMVVRRLDRRDLGGMASAIPDAWMPRRSLEAEADELVEEPASAAGWSWGAKAPAAFDLEDDGNGLTV